MIFVYFYWLVSILSVMHSLLISDKWLYVVLVFKAELRWNSKELIQVQLSFTPNSFKAVSRRRRQNASTGKHCG